MLNSPFAFGLGAILVWSTNAVVAKDALSQLTVAQVLTFQFLGASVVFAIARGFSVRKGPLLHPLPLLSIGLAGLVGTVVLQYLAFDVGPIAIVNILTYAWPLLTALIVVLSGSSVAPFQLILVSLAGFLGVAVLIGGSATGATDAGAVWGYVFAIGSAALMAGYSFVVAKTVVLPSDLLLPASLAGTFATAIWWAIDGGQDITVQNALTALYLGLGPMGLGFLLWSYAMKSGPVGAISTLGYATPVLSTLLLVLSGEQLTVLSLVAIVLIISSCAASGLMTTKEVARARKW